MTSDNACTPLFNDFEHGEIRAESGESIQHSLPRVPKPPAHKQVFAHWNHTQRNQVGHDLNRPRTLILKENTIMGYADYLQMLGQRPHPSHRWLERAI